MNAQIEKLTAALAEAKETIRTLKADKQTLKAEFKEALKAAKSGAKPVAKKAAKPVKKAVAKKTTAVKKAKAPAPKKIAPATTATEAFTENRNSMDDDIFSFDK